MGHRRNLAKVFVEGAGGRRIEIVGEADIAALPLRRSPPCHRS
jgi:hypothetical protein